MALFASKARNVENRWCSQQTKTGVYLDQSRNCSGGRLRSRLLSFEAAAIWHYQHANEQQCVVEPSQRLLNVNQIVQRFVEMVRERTFNLPYKIKL